MNSSDWGAICIIVLILVVGSCGIVEHTNDTNVKLEKIKQCAEKNLFCDEVK